MTIRKNQEPDHFNQPWMEWCDRCNEYVISLGGHCINDDSHRTYSLTPIERAQSGLLTVPKEISPEEDMLLSE
ncbi:MAG: hypothetical protein AABZ60_04020 [Planctomycetota bacterium]